MKKSFYCDNFNQTVTVNQNGYSNADNDKRKLLSLETNRRRRDMAVRVKKQIEKEEERRKQILRQRREYHENMSNKMRKMRHTKTPKLQNSQQTQNWDLENTLKLLRTDSFNSFTNHVNDRNNSGMNYQTVLEGAWNDIREPCHSPMAKYSGTNTINRTRTNDFYLKTFETKLMEQEQFFKQKQDLKTNEFERILDETVEGTEKLNNLSQRNIESSDTYRINSDLNCIKEKINCGLDVIPFKECNESIENSNGFVEEILDELTNDSSEETVEVEHKNKIESEKVANPTERVQTIQSAPINNNLKPAIGPIKSILKKDLNSKFNSNPDLSRILVRDSVEVTRIKSARVKRSNSFSQGINYTVNQTTNDERNCIDDENGRKIVRFADDPSLNQKDNEIVNRATTSNINTVTSENTKSVTTNKVQKISSVPSCTQLKPPLHPRSIQEGSYLQVTLRKPTVFNPPPKPRKINAEILENEIGSIMNQKKPNRNLYITPYTSDFVHKVESPIALNKTPTEREIDQLWAEVRECLSKSQNPSKTGSAGTPAGLSVRTVDSGSESSVWSAPAWQRNINKSPSFQVRHHGSITPKKNIYQGQEPPMKDFVIIHTPHESYINSGVTQQPLSVLTKEDQEFQQVSESLEEFLATEKACNTSQPHGNVFLQHTPILNRPKFHPSIKHQLLFPSASSSNPHSNSCSVTQRTQISMDEDKIKMSLDRLNEKLKNMTKIS